MDLYCERCGEPFEHYYVMNEMSEEERQDFLNGKCCPSCKGKEVAKRPLRAEISSALHSILGDDVDGLAAEMEDAEYLLGHKVFWGNGEDDGEEKTDAE